MPPVQSFMDKQAAWRTQRQQLEREIRVLVIEESDAIRAQLETILTTAHIPVRAVTAPAEGMELIARDHYSLVIVAAEVQGMRGMNVVRDIRLHHSEVDVVMTCWQPTVDLLANTFSLRVTDVISKPFDNLGDVERRIRASVRSNVNRRMRTQVLSELRDTLNAFDPDVRAKSASSLEQRLTSFKAQLGNFDRALVLELDDPNLRQLSERLLLADLHVETTNHLYEATTRVEAGDINLLVLCADMTSEGLVDLVGLLRESDPFVELLIVARKPSLDAALTALRLGLAGYLPWPPHNLPVVVMRIRDILMRAHRDRLVENLFRELYREITKREPTIEDRQFQDFQQLLGIAGLAPRDLPVKEANNPGSAAEYLEDLFSEEPRYASDSLLDEAEVALHMDASERRIHLRVPESQFVRFRPNEANANTLAYVGDLSEGGVFIRTKELLPKGTSLEIDLNVEHHGQGYVIRCRGRVAWVARDNKVSNLGPGFGVEFLSAPEDVVVLLKQIVQQRSGSFRVPESASS